MTLRRTLSRWRTWLAQRKERRAVAQLSCDKCDRVAMCGDPPSANCVERLQQNERDQLWGYRSQR
jgi:hypothetical protein